jgi:hypothetical protein
LLKAFDNRRCSEEKRCPNYECKKTRMYKIMGKRNLEENGIS